MPLPEGPGVDVGVDYFGPLPVTPQGNTYISLFIVRFSRRADMFPPTAPEFIAEATDNILVNQYISARAPYSRTTACSSSPSFHMLFNSCWGCASLLQAPIIPAVTGALSG